MKLYSKSGLLRLAAALLCFVASAKAQNSFTTLQSGFTQTLFGHAPAALAGVAFAPNGDVLAVHTCISYPPGNPISRFVFGVTLPDGHGGLEHPEAIGSPFPSGAQCGLTNHRNGLLYANTNSGIAKLAPDTFVQLGPLFGPPGDGLGIAVDPQTNNIVYVGRGCISASALTTCNIISINPDTLVFTNFAQDQVSDIVIDGIAFDPSGNFLFLSIRPFSLLPNPPCNDGCFAAILDRTGALVQAVPLPAAPDGISFHVNPSFVVTNNNDGTLTRLDFPSNNFALPPVQTVLASGGFRGDLSQIGPDGCLYLTQGGTRFSDNTTSTNSSVVQICPNFVPPPGVIPAPGQMTAKVNVRFHYSAKNSSGGWSGTKTVPSTGSLDIGPQAMEGNLSVSPGATIAVGYDFTLPGQHPQTRIVFSNAKVTFQASCASGAGVGTITIAIPDASYLDPVNSPSWYPSGDQSSAAVFQSSTTVPNLCSGGLVSLKAGAMFSAMVGSSQ